MEASQKEIEMEDTVMDNMNSVYVVESILDETVIQKVAEHLYNRYLQPKILPYVMMDTIEVSAKQVAVSASFI